MIRSQIKGWKFPGQSRKLNADGSTTLDTLRAEKTDWNSAWHRFPE